MKGDFQKLRLCSLGRQGRCAPDTTGVKGIHGNWVARLAAGKYIYPYSKGYGVHCIGSCHERLFVGSVWALGTVHTSAAIILHRGIILFISRFDQAIRVKAWRIHQLSLFEFIPSLQAAVSNPTYIVKPTVQHARSRQP
jgi:hypothetical protein